MFYFIRGSRELDKKDLADKVLDTLGNHPLYCKHVYRALGITDESPKFAEARINHRVMGYMSTVLSDPEALAKILDTSTFPPESSVELAIEEALCTAVLNKLQTTTGTDELDRLAFLAPYGSTAWGRAKDMLFEAVNKELDKPLTPKRAHELFRMTNVETKLWKRARRILCSVLHSELEKTENWRDIGQIREMAPYESGIYKKADEKFYLALDKELDATTSIEVADEIHALPELADRQHDDLRQKAGTRSVWLRVAAETDPAKVAETFHCTIPESPLATHCIQRIAELIG